MNMRGFTLKVLGTMITKENQTYMIPLFLVALIAGIVAMFIFVVVGSYVHPVV